MSSRPLPWPSRELASLAFDVPAQQAAFLDRDAHMASHGPEAAVRNQIRRRRRTVAGPYGVAMTRR